MRKTRKTIKIISIITVAFILLVGIICGLGFLKIQRDKRNFQTTDGMIDTFMTETDFSSLDIDESKKKISSFLDKLEEEDYIYDIQFDKDSLVYRFIYKNGIWGGISLRSKADQTFGIDGDKNFTSKTLNNEKVSEKTEKVAMQGDSKKSATKINASLIYAVGPEFDYFLNDMADRWGTDKVDFHTIRDVTVEKIKKLKKQDVYVFATHGIMYNGQSYIVIDADEKNLKYWKDLIRHDIVRVHGIDGECSYWIYPSFFKRYYTKGEFNDSMVIVEACQFFGCDCNGEAINYSYADMFINDLGADVVLGFKNTVQASYATGITNSVMNSMLQQGNTLEDALQLAIKKHGKNDWFHNIENDDYYAYPVIRGNAKKQIDISEKDIDKKKETASENDTEITTEILVKNITDAVSEEKQEKAGSSELPYTEEDTDKQVESIYEEVISSYIEHWKKYQNDGDFQALRDDYKYGISDLTYGGYNILLMSGDLSDAGYKIEDIDNDGTSELIIASKNSPLIYDLYTLVNGKPKLLLSSWDRCDVSYCGSYFYRDGSDGAAYHGTERYVLKGGDMQLIDDVYTEPSEENYEIMNYFYSKNSTYSTENRENISQEQYEKYRDNWYSESCIFNGLISFDEVTESSTEIKETGENAGEKTKTGNSPEETMSELTSDMACEAVEAYCREDNPSLNDMNSEEHTFYWLVEEETSTEYTILYRSYTGTLSHYHIDIKTGNVTLVEEGVDDTVTYNDLFNIWDYVK
ncbi:MAG: hypothetical protein V8R54_03610 [Coprococcus sp.]